MSAQKVRRWELESKQFGFGTEAFPIESSDGRYIEYADVAGLVEALRNLLSVNGATEAFDAIAAKKDARNELARWQS